jgi:hypothetical protein
MTTPTKYVALIKKHLTKHERPIFRSPALVCALATIGAASMTMGTVKGAPPVPTPPTIPCKITSALAKIPKDFSSSGGEDTVQQNLDVYSWNTFIALNWPAAPTNCAADEKRSIQDTSGPRVWESWALDTDIFVSPGSKPLPFCDSVKQRLAQLPPEHQAAVEKSGVSRFFRGHKKISPALKAHFPGIDEAVDGVLTDQNGRFVRYDIHVNKTEYDYIIKNNLWSAAGQNKFAGQVSFPTGSIEVKGAWKVLDPKKDDFSRFYKIQAVVFNDDKNPPSMSPGTNPVTLGLVGLHIIHKTPLQQSFIWSTFEHVDNTTKSFFNPNSKSPVNTQLAKGQGSNPTIYTELGPDGKPLNTPTQVTRVNSTQSLLPSDSLAINVNCGTSPTKQTTVNDWYRNELLKGSVWQNYQLISTQWINGSTGDIQPLWLANVTLETYNQGPTPPSDGTGSTIVRLPMPKNYQPFSTQVSSSCMKCHSLATLNNNQNTSADFSFMLGSAQ